MTAFMGKVLFVDLSTQTFTEEQIPESVYREYLSGIGLAAHLLYDRIPAGADPLGPENILGFVSGLLTGTPSLFSGRWMAVGKSPLTGTWGDANCGGYFALSIKQCGYDGIFFSGISDHPVYLFIDPKGPELRDASDLWGKDTVETETVLRERHGETRTPGVACIGQAGENLSRIAGIVHDHGRMAARSGLGAVMGSKNLKALVLAGARPVRPVDTEKMRQLTGKPAKLARVNLPLPAGLMTLLGKILANPKVSLRMNGVLYLAILRRWGTVGLNQTSVEWGDAPIKNWSGTAGDFPGRDSKQVSPAIVRQGEQRKYHCLACPLGCGGTMKPNGEIPDSHKPEYETTLAFSGLLLSRDWEAVLVINDLLNRAGMDSISAGGTVASAIEWYEKGWITRDDTDGLALTWGNSEAIIALVRKMIAREGFGDLLADGSKQAALKLEIQSRETAVTAGGSELAMHDPRLDPGFGLHASVEPTPGRHTTGAFIYYDMYRLWTRVPELPKPTLLYSKQEAFHPSQESAVKSVAMSNYANFYNALGICMFGTFLGADNLPLFDWANAAAGFDLTPQEYLKIGWRIQTLRQMFNVKQGIEPAQIRVSPRALGIPPQTSGPNRGAQVWLDEMRRNYWAEIGWDPETGVPTPETLLTLGLSHLIDREAVYGFQDYFDLSGLSGVRQDLPDPGD
ncbi:MAG: aldehyde ferredoxin oxidoreductase family protein [Anaerolineaceae bacterium]|jgi:aldehyde:ferredoxin oxidoreductase|nr:aldehyde ferredoxin oxidoreductase family protein [Anaerolineaceae bacterium]